MLFNNVLAASVTFLTLVGSVVGLEELQIGVLREVPEEECIRSAPGDRISVHYEGTLEDGTIFDSSYTRSPLVFQLGVGQVIAGWDQGLSRMCIGELRKLVIPPHLAYGDAGVGPIPPKATLTFVAELIDIAGSSKPSKSPDVDNDEL